MDVGSVMLLYPVLGFYLSSNQFWILYRIMISYIFPIFAAQNFKSDYTLLSATGHRQVLFPKRKKTSPGSCNSGFLVALRPSATLLPVGNTGLQMQKGGVFYDWSFAWKRQEAYILPIYQEALSRSNDILKTKYQSSCSLLYSCGAVF